MKAHETKRITHLLGLLAIACGMFFAAPHAAAQVGDLAKYENNQIVVGVDGFTYRVQNSPTARGLLRHVESETHGVTWKRHGVYEQRRSDGTRVSFEVYHEGLKQGVATYYHRDGTTVRSFIHYEDGVEDGESFDYDRKGKETFHYHYVKGQRDGEATYSKHGEVAEKVMYVNGKKVGKQYFYETSGVTKGKVWRYVPYVDDVRHGDEMTFRAIDGAAKTRRIWVKGKQIGKVVDLKPGPISITPRRREGTDPVR